MSEDQAIQFQAFVGELLASEDDDARILWTPVAQEFARAGPDAARVYLDAERQKLEERVQNLLSRIEGR